MPTTRQARARTRTESRADLGCASLHFPPGGEKSGLQSSGPVPPASSLPLDSIWIGWAVGSKPGDTTDDGAPADTDGDGQADYFEDTDGNGLFNAGDFGDWTNLLYLTASYAALNGNTNSNPLPADWRPDVMGAVGPDHFVAMLNGGVAVYSKSSGTELAYTNLEAFFRVTVANGQYAGTYPDTNTVENTGDPRVLYDPTSDRWFACAATMLEAGTVTHKLVGHVFSGRYKALSG